MRSPVRAMWLARFSTVSNLAGSESTVEVGTRRAVDILAVAAVVVAAVVVVVVVVAAVAPLVVEPSSPFG